MVSYECLPAILRLHFLPLEGRAKSITNMFLTTARSGDTFFSLWLFLQEPHVPFHLGATGCCPMLKG